MHCLCQAFYLFSYLSFFKKFERCKNSDWRTYVYIKNSESALNRSVWLNSWFSSKAYNTVIDDDHRVLFRRPFHHRSDLANKRRIQSNSKRVPEKMGSDTGHAYHEGKDIACSWTFHWSLGSCKRVKSTNEKSEVYSTKNFVIPDICRTEVHVSTQPSPQNVIASNKPSM